MDLLVLNTDFQTVAVVDTYESLIWTERYNSYGDFEIYAAITPETLNYFKEDYYLYLKESEYAMIIEGIRIKSDTELGNKLIITGRSLEVILDRRIVWKQTNISGNLQNGIKKLLEENIIAPVDAARRIDNFVFEASDDPHIVGLTVDAQYTGDNLYLAIKALCESHNIGFKVTLNDDTFVFKLYAGVDRSYNQTDNPYVVFSPKFENIINSEYYRSKASLKTVAFIAGEGEGDARKTSTITCADGAGYGLSRRELYIDARDISQTVDEVTLTESEYKAKLDQRGFEKLNHKDNILQSAFDGRVETTHLYVYGEDFFMGDVVQIANEYDMETEARVVELIRSHSITGVDIYPTFSTTN